MTKDKACWAIASVFLSHRSSRLCLHLTISDTHQSLPANDISPFLGKYVDHQQASRCTRSKTSSDRSYHSKVHGPWRIWDLEVFPMNSSGAYRNFFSQHQVSGQVIDNINDANTSLKWSEVKPLCHLFIYSRANSTKLNPVGATTPWLPIGQGRHAEWSCTFKKFPWSHCLQSFLSHQL